MCDPAIDRIQGQQHLLQVVDVRKICAYNRFVNIGTQLSHLRDILKRHFKVLLSAHKYLGSDLIASTL